jgi:putative MFS transporter
MEGWQNKLNNQMETISWGKFQYIAFIACFSVSARQAWINDMMWMIGLSVVLYVQSDEWGLDPVSFALYESLILGGLLLGAYFWSYIADRYGRMKSFKTQVCILFCGAVGVTFSFNLVMIVPFAFILGFAIGGELALASTVYKELIPASYSSTICILMTGFNLGNLIADALAMFACDMQYQGLAGWRWMFMVMLVLEAAFIAIRMKLPETPFFLASKGRMLEAAVVLNYVRPRQICITNTGKPLEETILILREDFAIVDEDPNHGDKESAFLKLFSLEYLRPTLAFAAFGFMNNIALIGIILFMPQILHKMGAEFQSCQVSYFASAIQQATSIPACLISWMLLDTALGRRWSIVIFTIASGVLMICFLFVHNLAQVRPIQMIVVSSLCIALNYMGWAGFYTMIPETYPAEIRGTGAGWVSINLLLSTLVCPIVTGAVISSAGLEPVVAFFAVLITASGLVGLALKETQVRLCE